MTRAARPRWLWPATIVLAVAVAPLLAPNPYVVRIMVQAGIAVLVVTGLNLVFGYAGQVSLGHAAFYGLGAYASAVLAVKLGWNPFAGIAGAALVTAATAYVIAVPALRLKGHYLAMATLGFNEIITILIVEWAWLTDGPSGFRDIPRLSLAGVAFTSHTMSYYLVWSFALVGMLIARNLVSSRTGRALRALHDADVAAAASGVDVARAKVRVFVISAVYAGVAGALYAHFVTFISPPTFSVAASVGFVVMVVLGGMGTLAGPAAGALILTFGPEYLRAYQDYTLMVYGALLVATMVFVPRGLASLLPCERRTP